mgnify:CR=1 FL=1
MEEPLTTDKLRDYLESSAYRLQTMSQKYQGTPDAYELFDKLAQEYNYMFSYIIDYLEQNQ